MQLQLVEGANRTVSVFQILPPHRGLGKRETNNPPAATPTEDNFLGTSYESMGELEQARSRHRKLVSVFCIYTQCEWLQVLPATDVLGAIFPHRVQTHVKKGLSISHLFFPKKSIDLKRASVNRNNALPL